jgi:hypothetical protein
MPTTTISWNLNANGNWATSADWTPHRHPNSTDNALINTVGLHTVTHSKGADTVNTLTVGNDNLVVSGGSLTINSTSSFARALAVSGGTLALGGAATAATLTQSGGAIAGAGTLTVTGPAAFSGPSLETGPGVTVLDGVSTFSNNAALSLDGGRTLENRGTLTLSTFQEIDLGIDPFGAALGGGTLKNDAGGTIDLGQASFVRDGAGAIGVVNAGTLELTATAGQIISGATIGAPVSNTGKILVQAGELDLFGFTNSGSGTISIASGASLVSFASGSASAAAFTLASGATLDFFGDSLFSGAPGAVFSLGAGTIGAGTVGVLGAGELALGANAVTIANFVQDAGTVSGSGTLTLTGQASLSSLQTGPGTTLLTATSTFALNGFVPPDGLPVTGGFNLDGGRILENQGGTGTITSNIVIGGNPFGPALGGGTLKNDAGGSLSFTGGISISAGVGTDSFINAGAIEKLKVIREHNPPDTTVATIGVSFTDTGVIKIDGGTLAFSGASNSIGGPVSGVGGVAFTGGTSAVNAGAAITTASLSLSGTAVVDLNESLAYSGVFSQTGGALDVAGSHALSLTGLASLTGGAVGGAGTVDLSSATVGALTVGGTATLADVGTVDQNGIVTLGDSGPGAATLSIAAGATYSVDGAFGIAGSRTNASSIVDNGLLIASAGTGTSVVGVSVADAGVIEVASGTLDFTHAITGSGSLAIDAGATLQLGFSASSSLTTTFKGSNGTLALGNPAQFAATISGFDSTDAIQLVGRAATQATLQPGDKLVITNSGTAVATLQLTGNYAGDSFNVASDGAGGTFVTVTTPSGSTVGGSSLLSQGAGAAASHTFIAAMAGLGGSGAGSLEGAGPIRPDGFRPALATPGAMHSA